ncbi:DUF6502 family protein [Roseococcus sp. DSY-14]|uniref:DUF6502 family protein n=1 Tax=Roseococcus sp. DSY-14 TaxID=3369650 RepID=UPI00387A9B8E
MPALPSPNTLLRPLRRLLRPLVALLVRAGVTLPLLEEELRRLYLDAALATGATTDSRLTLLTGIHRKEIRRLRAMPPPAPDAVPAVVTLNGAILARWTARPDFPAPLDRAAFDALVAGITTDLRPRAVLDAWAEAGMLERLEDGRLRLADAAHIPRADEGGRLHYFGRNLHDHLRAACANLLAPEAPPFLERALHWDGLTPAAAARLEEAGREAAMAMLLELSHLARRLSAEGEGEARVNLGVFLLREDGR